VRLSIDEPQSAKMFLLDLPAINGLPDRVIKQVPGRLQRIPYQFGAITATLSPGCIPYFFKA
jgi:hypothetical protein